MAEILVKLSDNIHPDPTRDVGSYKRGMPVVVMPDGHPWGDEERPPKFFVMKFPGVPVEDLLDYVAEEPGPVDGSILARRRWRFSVDELPRDMRRRIEQSGVMVVRTSRGRAGDTEWTDLRTRLRDREGRTATQSL